MTAVNFPVALGGDGNTYSDDGSSSRDMNNGGYESYLLAAMQQTVAMAGSAASSAVSAVNAPGSNGTSTNSLNVALGPQTFTTQTGKAWVVGQSVKVAATAAPGTWMHGDITAYNGGTGSMTVNVTTINGSGSAAAWTISLSGPVLIVGAVTSQIADGSVSTPKLAASVISGATVCADPDPTADSLLMHDASAGAPRRVPISRVLPAGLLLPYAGHTPPPYTLLCDGASYSAASYAQLFAALVKSAAVTISVASPGVVTWTGHNLGGNYPVKFSTTGALPTGLAVNTVYYVVPASITANTFQVSATPGGAAINTSGTQAGAHTGICAPWGCALDLSTFQVPDTRGRHLRGLDMGAGNDPSRAMGSYQGDAMPSHAHGSGAWALGGGGSASYYAIGFPGSNWNTEYAGSGNETRVKNVAATFVITY
ncbi:phage tail protein [Methylogaea oryzae]|uniref:Phage tail collar domain-containing protein n=1 Tax=Methylogaea oryzae TaxID=1295382 RepID=A0A8D4VNI5_9GAMM|nr:phage tail protein [Methylogaea oryzae]BBL70322.1 hypothetical protein MoryE10_09280 [Methylogaea oryzae]